MDYSIKKTVTELCNQKELLSVLKGGHHSPMPSGDELCKIVEDIRAVIFPGYYGFSDMNKDTIEYYTGAAIDRIYQRLSKQIRRGICFTCSTDTNHDCTECEKKSKDLSIRLIEMLPRIRELLLSDALAAYEGDPAAHSVGETIYCYPSIRAMTNQRIAHELFTLGVEIIPRLITEHAHSETGIDIHPGATIGEGFFIDHGTGVVIGETCIIGKNVRLYQGVTLGAKSFPKDENGNPIKGIARHPIVEDDVVIYAGATILGRITIGKNSIIGGNVWVTADVPEGGRVLQRRESDI